MKNIICLAIALLLITAQNTNGQTPIFHKQNGLTMLKYRIFRWNLPPSGNSMQFEKTFIIKGDTTINSKVYSKLYYDTTDNDTVHAKDLVHTAYLYKDSGKVWSVDTALMQKKIFDFTVAKNDSLPWLLYTCVLVNTGTYTRNGNTHTMYIVAPGLALANYYYTETYGHIEGQGILSNTLSYIPIGIHEVFELVAVNDTSMKAGHTPDVIDSSVYTLNVNTTLVKQLVKIYPNPAHDRVCIDVTNNKAQSVVLELYSVDGKKQAAWKLKHAKNDLNISHLPAGLYNYRLVNDSRVVVTGKLQKQ